MNVIDFPIWRVRPSMHANYEWMNTVMNSPCMDRIPSIEICDCVGRDNEGSITCLDCDDNPLGNK